MKIVTVLRTGGEYQIEHVVALARGLQGNVPSGTGFVCLTDKPCTVRRACRDAGVEIEARMLVHDWPLWWSKIEMFLVDGPALYLDLDTIVVGDLARMLAFIEGVAPGRLLMLQNFYDWKWGSGVMGWSGGVQWLYDEFVAQHPQFRDDRPQRVRTDRGIWNGDQEWIRHAIKHRGDEAILVQHKCEGMVASYKVDVKPNGLRDGTALVVFHGKPRPWDLDPRPAWMPAPIAREEVWR